jgi:hypothetical protein
MPDGKAIGDADVALPESVAEGVSPRLGASGVGRGWQPMSMVSATTPNGTTKRGPEFM